MFRAFSFFLLFRYNIPTSRTLWLGLAHLRSTKPRNRIWGMQHLRIPQMAIRPRPHLQSVLSVHCSGTCDWPSLCCSTVPKTANLWWPCQTEFSIAPQVPRPKIVRQIVTFCIVARLNAVYLPVIFTTWPLTVLIGEYPLLRSALRRLWSVPHSVSIARRPIFQCTCY